MIKRVFFLALASAATLGASTALGAPAAGDRTLETIIAHRNAITLQEPSYFKGKGGELMALADNGRTDNDTLYKLFATVNIPDAKVEELIATQAADGSWPGINYKDDKRSSWSPNAHYTNIAALTRVYKSPGSKFYNSKQLSATIHRALDFWVKANPESTNWWYNQIGVPMILSPAMLLLRGELSPAELAGCLKILNKAQFGMTGQNSVWLAGNVCMRAMLTGDTALVRKARNEIFSEVKVSSGDEGLQRDWSFHQHGPQMQFGNYGLSFVTTLAEWVEIFAGTPLALEPEKLALLEKYITDGVQWTVWRGYMDVNACARQVVRNAQQGKGYSLALGVFHISLGDTANRALVEFLQRNLTRPQTPNDLVGSRYFWRSDYYIQRTPSWFASVRMHSSRTVPFEMTNSENLKGIYAADGTLMVMRSGREYVDIFPVWDWKRLPGTTVADNGKPIPFFHPKGPVNRSPLVGGIADGGRGFCAMSLDYDNRRTKQAYFFCERGIAALGAGIDADSMFHTTTSLAQCLLAGDVVYSPQNAQNGKTAKLAKGSQTTLRDPRWILHDSVGYMPLAPANITVAARTQSGNWKDISGYDRGEAVSKDVFSAWIDQGNGPQGASYAYFVAPGAGMGEMDALAANKPVRILSNSRDIQSVMVEEGKQRTIMAVFYTPGTLSVPEEITIAVKKPMLVMIKATDTEAWCSVADPSQTLDSVSLSYPSSISDGTIALDGPLIRRFHSNQKPPGVVFVWLDPFKGERWIAKIE